MNVDANKRRNQAVVLLVEDSPADRLTVERAIEDGRVRCDLLTAENGVQALSMLRNEAPYEDKVKYPQPDLILMDINMPVMDGITTLNHIRNDANLHNLPIVMLTTSDAPDDVKASYTDGANAFVTKPVQNQDFIAAIQKLDCFWFQLVTLPDTAQ